LPCYSISLLKDLEILNISWNELSEGLPDNIFTSLQSLRELNMEMCNLVALPNRCLLYYEVEPCCPHCFAHYLNIPSHCSVLNRLPASVYSLNTGSYHFNCSATAAAAVTATTFTIATATITTTESHTNNDNC